MIFSAPLRATAYCYSALYANARLSVRPSHGWISQRRLKVGSPALSARELLRAESTFQRCIDYVDIAGRS